MLDLTAIRNSKFKRDLKFGKIFDWNTIILNDKVIFSLIEKRRLIKFFIKIMETSMFIENNKSIL